MEVCLSSLFIFESEVDIINAVDFGVIHQHMPVLGAKPGEYVRTPPRNDSRTAEVRHLDRLKQTPLPSVRQLEKLAWRPA